MNRQPAKEASLNPLLPLFQAHRLRSIFHPLAPLPFLAVLALAMALGGCLIKEQEISIDPDKKRQVSLLSGVEEPDKPASPQFKQLTLAQVSGSLTRLTVEVAEVISFVRGDPTPFLTPDQVGWAAAAIHTHVPKLKPDQRLRLEFEDQHNKLTVEVQLWGEGNELVYYFTKLSSRKEEGGFGPGESMRPTNFVTLVERPGQNLDYDANAFILKDRLFTDTGTQIADRRAKLDLITRMVEKKIVRDEEEARDLSTLVDKNPGLQLQTLQTYFEKLETLSTAYKQNLFTKEEFETRRKTLRATLGG